MKRVLGVVTLLPVYYTVNQCLFSWGYVSGRSMQPTLNPFPVSSPSLTSPSTSTPTSSSDSSSSSTHPTNKKDEEKKSTETFDSSRPTDIIRSEIILVNKIGFKPKRGDVVVVYDPTEYATKIAKRLIALEGDIVICKDPPSPSSSVFLNKSAVVEHGSNKKQKEDVIVFIEQVMESMREDDNSPSELVVFQEFGDTENNNEEERVVYRVPEGHCWVEGDNPPLSRDSRDFGPVPLAMVEGKVTHVIWPPSHIRRVDSIPPSSLSSPHQTHSQVLISEN
eukprot:TRINITY_DN2203_c0_g1_i1.p1 TRINITY_DN2203_c0_g1~~TRINITY_DN2203_c0_g1_i1.p1  ORF type:complete len:279 (-),score=76.65 TRINITY_DN2203_c0_g1_i1:173-1009(-)